MRDILKHPNGALLDLPQNYLTMTIDVTMLPDLATCSNISKKKACDNNFLGGH